MPDDRWLCTASFGRLDGEYGAFAVRDNLVDDDFNPIVATRDLSGAEIIRTAPHTFGMSAAYTAPFAGVQQLASQVGWCHRRRTYNTLEATNASRQDAYGLLDEKYLPTAIELSGGSLWTGTTAKHWAEPRRYVLELTHGFARGAAQLVSACSRWAAPRRPLRLRRRGNKEAHALAPTL